MFPLGQLGVPGTAQPRWETASCLAAQRAPLVAWHLFDSVCSKHRAGPAPGLGTPGVLGTGLGQGGRGRGRRPPRCWKGLQKGLDPELQHSWAVGKWHQFSSPIYWGKGSGVGQRRVLKPCCPPGLTPHVCSAPSPEPGTPAPPLGHCRVFPCLPSLSQAHPSASIHTAASSTPQSPTCPNGVGAEPHTAALGQGHACSVSTEWCQPVHRDRANRLPVWLFHADLSLPPTAIFSSFSVNQAAGIVFPPLSP